MTFEKRRHFFLGPEAFSLAALLSFSGGLQDAYTYFARGKVFANAQTGNVVLLSQALLDGSNTPILPYLLPLGLFALGILTAEVLRHLLQHTRRFHWHQAVLLLESALLLLSGLLPESLHLLANGLVSFSCAMQVQTFRSVNGHAFASTMCIGNLRSGLEALFAYGSTKKNDALFRAAHYLGILICFVLGAGTGGLLVPVLGLQTIWISCGLLWIALALLFFCGKVSTERSSTVKIPAAALPAETPLPARRWALSDASRRHRHLRRRPAWEIPLSRR